MLASTLTAFQLRHQYGLVKLVQMFTILASTPTFYLQSLKLIRFGKEIQCKCQGNAVDKVSQKLETNTFKNNLI